MTPNPSHAGRGIFLLMCAVVAVYWLALVISTHIPMEGDPVPSVNDKTLHLSAFGVLAFLIAITWNLHNARYGTQTAAGLKARIAAWFATPFPLLDYLLVWTAVAAYGSVDEATQTPFGRTCDIWDWVADARGAALALLLFAAVRAFGRWRLRPGRIGAAV